MILEEINDPSDLRKLDMDELNALCAEIREFLIDNVSKTGGHLASNLGIVELTVALERVFDFSKDRIVFDVGHQSYVHKLLTGRRKDFKTLRSFGGMSGFPKTAESKYDAFNTGHSSTSLSAALGMARARDLKKENYSVVALFGDGALTGGMMYEAMNDIGSSKTPLILILNDNVMSIARNVGSMSRHLRNLRMKPRYFQSKQFLNNILDKFSLGRAFTNKIIRPVKRIARNILFPNNLFEDLGFHYMGPVNGHDIETMIGMLSYAKTEKTPVIIHVITKKGKGYAPAENDPKKFHGVGKFDKDTGNTGEVKKSYSDQFGETLVRLAAENENVVAITGAMPNGTGLDEFAAKYKKRFFDVGIAEQHGVTLAAGMAISGLVPVIPLYSSFLQRAYDQTLHDVCLQELHVVFPIDRAGIVGADGETHQGVYDIAYLSHMPNMTILSPSNFEDLDSMLDYAVNVCTEPVAVRYPRGGDCAPKAEPFVFGKARIRTSGSELTIICTGRMTIRALETENILKSEMSCEIVELPTIVPLDTAAIAESVKKTGRVIVIEDGTQPGGLGTMVAAFLEESGINARFKSFAFPKQPIVHGSITELDRLYGLDAQTIASYVHNNMLT